MSFDPNLNQHHPLASHSPKSQRPAYAHFHQSKDTVQCTDNASYYGYTTPGSNYHVNNPLHQNVWNGGLANQVMPQRPGYVGTNNTPHGVYHPLWSATYYDDAPPPMYYPEQVPSNAFGPKREAPTNAYALKVPDNRVETDQGVDQDTPQNEARQGCGRSSAAVDAPQAQNMVNSNQRTKTHHPASVRLYSWVQNSGQGLPPQIQDLISANPPQQKNNTPFHGVVVQRHFTAVPVQSRKSVQAHGVAGQCSAQPIALYSRHVDQTHGAVARQIAPGAPSRSQQTNQVHHLIARRAFPQFAQNVQSGDRGLDGMAQHVALASLPQSISNNTGPLSSETRQNLPPETKIQQPRAVYQTLEADRSNRAVVLQRNLQEGHRTNEIGARATSLRPIQSSVVNVSQLVVALRMVQDIAAAEDKFISESCQSVQVNQTRAQTKQEGVPNRDDVELAAQEVKAASQVSVVALALARLHQIRGEKLQRFAHHVHQQNEIIRRSHNVASNSNTPEMVSKLPMKLYSGHEGIYQTVINGELRNIQQWRMNQNNMPQAVAFLSVDPKGLENQQNAQQRQGTPDVVIKKEPTDDRASSNPNDGFQRHYLARKDAGSSVQVPIKDTTRRIRGGLDSSVPHRRGRTDTDDDALLPSGKRIKCEVLHSRMKVRPAASLNIDDNAATSPPPNISSSPCPKDIKKE
ncbi:hypothetical protein K504DRAFT_500763 [Pleomassaria siparia CBS 279.74]|uniref:Uncharacterized protein n=1 Tax=Pleomassaria siparia CBS 279.74 TaxID=1314801 RepID=A0A6G1KDB5_9PLEO|nr:hypothetical protein K504DRAFT_500763 [Pleomassaria siparia CBS 279.74]